MQAMTEIANSRTGGHAEPVGPGNPQAVDYGGGKRWYAHYDTSALGDNPPNSWVTVDLWAPSYDDAWTAAQPVDTKLTLLSVQPAPESPPDGP